MAFLVKHREMVHRMHVARRDFHHRRVCHIRIAMAAARPPDVVAAMYPSYGFSGFRCHIAVPANHPRHVLDILTSVTPVGSATLNKSRCIRQTTYRKGGITLVVLFRRTNSK